MHGFCVERCFETDGDKLWINEVEEVPAPIPIERHRQKESERFYHDDGDKKNKRQRK